MKQVRRTLAGLALAAVLLTGSVFAAVPAAPEGSCVLDEANVLSERTEQAVNDLTIALSEACGAEIAVLTVDFTGTSSTADYAVEALNSWGVGDKDKNNGVLLLLVIGAEDYYCTVGTGLEKDLPPQKIDDLLWNNLEEGFAMGDYDAGVTAFANAMYDELCGIYGVQPDQSTGGSVAPAPERPSFLARIGGFLIAFEVDNVLFHPTSLYGITTERCVRGHRELRLFSSREIEIAVQISDARIVMQGRRNVGWNGFLVCNCPTVQVDEAQITAVSSPRISGYYQRTVICQAHAAYQTTPT